MIYPTLGSMNISLKGFLPCFSSEKPSSCKIKDGLNSFNHLDREGGKVRGISTHLGSLYAWLGDDVANVVRSVGRYDIVTHVDSCFLQMFVWEPFSIVASKLMEYLEVAMEEAACQEGSRSLR